MRCQRTLAVGFVLACTAVAARGGETPPGASSAATPSAGARAPSGLRVVKAPFGTMPDGAAVALYTLSNGSGLRVKITPFGAAIASVETPDRAGKWANLTTGHRPGFGGSCEHLDIIVNDAMMPI
jgi:hypothetical protein